MARGICARCGKTVGSFMQPSGWQCPRCLRVFCESCCPKVGFLIKKPACPDCGIELRK